MADELSDEEDSASSAEGDVIEEIDGWMILEQDPELRPRLPESSSDEEMDESDRVAFDRSLPTAHSYLGEGMEELHGRTIHDANEIVKLPLLLLPGVTLVPGQILPLHLFHPQLVSMMKRLLQADKTFGLLNFSKPLRTQENQLSRRQAAKIGTTAEIFSFKEEDEYGISTIRMKAEGRQRFRVLEYKRQLDGVMMGKVKILEESSIPYIPADSILCHYKTKPNYLSSIMSRETWIARNQRIDNKQRSTEQFPPTIFKTARTSVSAFPYWIYRQYNPLLLMDLLLEELRSWNTDLESKNLPTDPSDFSHWLTANLPLDDKLRNSLLEIDCPIVRLRRQLDIMKQCSGLQCAECGNTISDKKDLFSMSLRGPLGAYVNPGGYVHETVTFYKATGLRLRGSPSAENSWFPGYAWTIAECESCSVHMGWRFTACTKGLTPAKFWGLTRASLIPQLISSNSRA